MDYQQKEDLKQKVTVGGVSFIVGAIAWWIVLASGFGWVSPSTAEQRASDAVQAKVDQVLAPICADRFMANKTALAKFTKASEDYDRTEVVQNTMGKIDGTKVDYQLSSSCANAIEARLKSAARKPAPAGATKS